MEARRMVESMLMGARAILRRVALFFTRSAHRELLTRSLRPHVESLRGTVIDIGGGRNSPLAQHWPAVAQRFRLDISARFRPDLLADAHVLPLPSEAIDGVVLSEVMEHLHPPQSALSEIHRLLRPGGVLIGSVPFAIGIHTDPHDHFGYTHEPRARRPDPRWPIGYTFIAVKGAGPLLDVDDAK